MTAFPANEFAYINWVRQHSSGGTKHGVVVGIGDDAAVQQLTPGWELLIAKDVLMEGTHFKFPDATPEQVGRKALGVNLSDIAAMGGLPVTAFIGLVLPRSRGVEFARQLHLGVAQLAEEFGVTIAGGDTNIWDGPLVISVTLLGEVEQGTAILRKGAQVGDQIFVTGPLGGSLASQRHLSFTPRIELARRLKQAVNVRAMLDLSDGLARDLGHILAESDVGAELSACAIPIHADVSRELSEEQRLEHAMSDGEDFELVCVVAPEDVPRIRSEFDQLTHLGEIIAEREFRLRTPDGQHRLVLPSGYEHQF